MNNYSVTVAIQCRFDSTRLPGKALLPISDTTLIGMCVQRSRLNNFNTYLLTSSSPDDDIIVSHCRDFQLDGIIRGSKLNVLSRFVQLVNTVHSDYYVRVTADNPLTDFRYISPLISYMKKNNLSYSTIATDKCPEGTNLEIFTKPALLASALSDQSTHNLEHVTYGLKSKASFTNYLSLASSYSSSSNFTNLSYTIDTEADYQAVAHLINVCIEARDLSWKSLDFVSQCTDLALTSSNSMHPNLFIRNH